MKKFEIILNTINILFFFLATATFIARVYYIDRVSTSGIKLSEITQKIDIIQKNNEYFEFEYDKSNSNTNIYDRAQQLGYVRGIQEYIYLPSLASR